ncbi:MAG TPA: nuclear transport factor 2 family protein [Nocardioidaceae bacterium]|nr:nuclear transport factor 2 family protein [Nocardioidaceae bacterium]
MKTVQDANTAFYEAFEQGDIDAMRALWLDGPDTICVHPGGTPLRGTSAIARSWALIMANTPYIQFFLTDVEVSVQGDVATVTCTENVLTGDENPDVFGGARAVATNVFLRRGDDWRLWVHHASPVLSEASDED